MWVLSFLPDWIFHILTLAGVFGVVASFVLTFVPLVMQYRLTLQVASVIVLTFGIYFEGAISDNNAWLARVAEMEKKVAEAEAKANHANTHIATKVLTQQQLIRDKGNDVVKYIDREVTKYDSQCTVSAQFITAINNAAQGGKK